MVERHGNLLGAAARLYERHRANRSRPFNVFTVLRSASDEVNLHSRFLHALLDHVDPSSGRRENLERFLEGVAKATNFVVAGARVKRDRRVAADRSGMGTLDRRVTDRTGSRRRSAIGYGPLLPDQGRCVACGNRGRPSLVRRVARRRRRPPIYIGSSAMRRRTSLASTTSSIGRRGCVV